MYYGASVSWVDNSRGLGLKKFVYTVKLSFSPNLNNLNLYPLTDLNKLGTHERQHKNTFLAEQVETEALTNTGPGGQSIWDR